MYCVETSDLSMIAGGDMGSFYDDVGRPSIIAGGAALAYGADAAWLAGAGAAIALYGVEQLIKIGPELGPALEELNRLSDAQLYDRQMNPYMYPD